MTIPHSQLIILLYVLGFVLLVFVSIIVSLIKLFNFVLKQLKEESEKNKKAIENLTHNTRI
jgi:hypothetical protein